MTQTSPMGGNGQVIRRRSYPVTAHITQYEDDEALNALKRQFHQIDILKAASLT